MLIRSIISILLMSAALPVLSETAPVLKVVTMNQENPELASLRMVAMGRVDVFICEEKACNHLIDANEGRYPELSRVTALPGVVGDERFFRAAFSRQRPDARALRDQFNQELERLELEATD